MRRAIPGGPVALAALAALAVVGLAASPAAADAIVRGAVVKVEEREVYVGLGRADGVVPGGRLRLKRPVRLRHPVTRAWLVDWVPLGAASVTSAGERLSMARVEADLVAAVKVGDVVEIYVERDEVAAPPPPPPAAAAATPEVDEVTAQVLGMWQASAGLSIDERIAAWERFLARGPDGPHVEPLRQDVAILRAQREAMRLPEDTAGSPALGGLAHVQPSRAGGGAAIPLAFVIDDPVGLATAWLHYRTVGGATFRRVQLGREGELYLRGTIPADAVHPPGVEYFVEVATTGGEVGTAIASHDRPVAVAVDGPSLSRRFGDERRRTEVALRASYTSFDSLDRRAGDRTDVFFVAEADVLYRLAGPLRGVRIGYGSVQGEGGHADRVYDAATPAPPVGFNYGYAELELAASPRVGLGGRLVAGIGQDGLGVGVEGRLRLGRMHETNLTLAAGGVQELGFLTEARLEVQAFERVPVGLAGAVTDQPNNGDLGVRLATDVGWRLVDWLTPTVRVSYQARTVAHAGLGAGLALVFGW